jgi:hypothetical protein
MTRSKRLADLQSKKKQLQKQKEEEDRQKKRRKPKPCTNCNRNTARTGYRLCQKCHDTAASKRMEENELILYQGCPQLINSNKMIRWIIDHPGPALWIQRTLEFKEEHSSSYSSVKRLEIVGWKGANDPDESRIIEGDYFAVTLTVDETRETFGYLNIELEKQSTPRQLLSIINEFIFNFYRRRWETMIGRALTAPEFSPAVCQTKRCPNGAYVFAYCSRCCQVKYHVEVKESTLNAEGIDAGLGLFACRNFKAGDYVGTYTWDMQPGMKGLTQYDSSHNSIGRLCVGSSIRRRTIGL